MPHRAGYFVMAYNWDHHCHDLIESLKSNFHHMRKELNELPSEEVSDRKSLLNYFKKLHYNKELYFNTVKNIDDRQFSIKSLGYRGYGVNMDLLNALDGLKTQHAGHIYWMIEEGFKRHLAIVKKRIYMPVELIENMDTGYVVFELCKKMKLVPEEHIPEPPKPVELNNLEEYYNVMARSTPWNVNTAIFQRLFLNLGCSSMTIMKGTVGHTDSQSPQELKIIGNRNFLAMFRETFANLHLFTDINLDLLRTIHKILSNGLVPHAGDFRPHDFPDRNGVTFENNNFGREINDLGHVLWETAQSFNHLDNFVLNIARAYYMFIGIHPFWDSNGRVGKCFINYMFLKKGLPPISFDDSTEVLSLPRYGGTMDDMYIYIKTRLLMAVEDYYYERRKLELFDFINKQVYNVSFDSGVYFRQIDDHPQKIELNFQIFLLNWDNPLFNQLFEQCRIVVSDEHYTKSLILYCGFSHARHGGWEHVFTIKGDYHIEERPYNAPIRLFDVDLIIELKDYHYNFNYFSCSIVTNDGSMIYNNKGLNYSYQIEK